MIRDLFVPLAEMLFAFTGGVPLMNSWWMAAWIGLGTILLLFPFYASVRFNLNRFYLSPTTVFLVSFFPMLLIITGPPMIQMQLLTDCRKVETHVEIFGEIENMNIRQCRYKKNFYQSDFGDWELFQDYNLNNQ